MVYERPRPRPRKLRMNDSPHTDRSYIGIGVSGIAEAAGSDPVDLIEPGIGRRAAAERAMDRVRTRFGRDAVIRGKLYGRRKSRPSDAEIEEGKTK